MNILMMTNTFSPHVGGVARSVAFFTEEYRRLGHEVLVIAPEFPNMPGHEQGVVRIPAIQNFNGSDFSVMVPVPGFLNQKIAGFHPDLVHSHHPFLVGSTAVRVAAQYQVPLVFTHHTLYEHYTHYVPGDSSEMRKFAIRLATGYCNLCERVFAPSESVATLLKMRGVQTPVSVLPTGVHVDEFSQGNGAAIRRRMQIPGEAFVVGHLGRLAPEKNLPFLTRAVCRFLAEHPQAHFLIVGTGESEKEIDAIAGEAGVAGRLHRAGTLQKQDLVNAYHAMDLFAFASTSETQGMVLTEAMAAGVPVVAIDASGAREVVKDGENGRLLMGEDEASFAAALADLAALGKEDRARMTEAARHTADAFSMKRCARRALGIYEELCHSGSLRHEARVGFGEETIDQLKTQWDIMANFAEAVVASLREDDETDVGLDDVKPS